MLIIDIIGFVAGVLTTSSFIPQFIKIIMDKSAKEISFLMYIVISIGIFLWFLYGLMINSLPIIVANGVSFILTILILLGKIRYDSHYHLFCNK